MAALAKRAAQHGALKLARLLLTASEALENAADPRSHRPVEILTVRTVIAEMDRLIADAEKTAARSASLSLEHIRAVAAAQALREFLVWIEDWQ